MPDPLVLLPDMMCDARLFGPQIAALSATHALHLAPLTGGHSVEALAAKVLTHVPERFALAGQGFGAMVAMEVLKRAGGRVSRIALIDTTCHAELPTTAAAREERIVAVQGGRLREVLEADVRRDAPTGPYRGEILDLLQDMGMALGDGVYIAQSRAMQRRPDQQSTLRRIKVPGLVVCGDEDNVYPERRHAFMADLMPNARLEVIRQCGRRPSLERPDRLTEILSRWLSAPDGQVS
ncbi:alpha/beta fold hydrolase [Anianabacter salinae]|uniref:alpha/beta fold hydrolase n=1 Tax=Anianabacter salinae TaxID=2851023 RepID=UPI00225E608A|nr:alpha/beta hydrolase [Anianabacter salinae]MBV0912574.1 alpha/beta hydrolase [Anianabacter salinae]